MIAALTLQGLKLYNQNGVPGSTNAAAAAAAITGNTSGEPSGLTTSGDKPPRYDCRQLGGVAAQEVPSDDVPRLASRRAAGR